MIFRRIARARRPQLIAEVHPDDLPKRGLFSEPVRVTRLEALPPDTDDAGHARATFLVEVKDSEDRRCPDLAIEATLRGPERTATVSGTTDMMGRIRFRMAGPPGAYHVRILDVAAGGLEWDGDAGPQETSTVLSANAG